LKWHYRAEMINACNCDWGCPCNFNQRPTNGFCNGVYGARITSGTAGTVKLDGLKFVWAAMWPKAIHEGKGTAKILIEEKATREQRKSLDTVLRGQEGGLPWGLFRATVDTWLDTGFAPIEWKFDGADSYYKAGTEAQARLEPMRNPVTGDEARARIVLPNGIVCKELEVTSTKSFAVFTKGLKFAAPGKYRVLHEGRARQLRRLSHWLGFSLCEGPL
jgi:hypothetical protein